MAPAECDTRVEFDILGKGKWMQGEAQFKKRRWQRQRLGGVELLTCVGNFRELKYSSW